MDERDNTKFWNMRTGKTKKTRRMYETITKPENETEPGLLVVEHGVLTLLLKPHRRAP
jgi:hypothetical protein